jgi:NAD(P)-dependent dehydrogenase (short-subunit alcohol dehydrogenase family)
MLKDKHIVVFAVADQAAREGAQVIIASANRERVDQALARLPRGAKGHAVDLRSEPAIRALFEQLGTIDHLVYTAGEQLLVGPLSGIDLAQARTFFELRFWGALAAIKAAQPHMARTGSIVLTGGAAGERPFPGFVIGSSICGAMDAVTRTLAMELAPIRVNIVTPGYVDTELWSNVPADARKKMFDDAAAKLPVGRVGTAADVAEHYLSFMRGGYVTGQSLIVDGGGVLV